MGSGLVRAQHQAKPLSPTTPPVALSIALGQVVLMPTPALLPESIVSSASSHQAGYLLTAVYGWNALQRRAEINAYLSTDYGLSWQHVLQDASTPWVSEISCAYGPDGHAYVVTGASKRTGITRGHPYGQRHLFHSSDGGRTWQGPTSGPFVDWTALTVDTTRSQYRGHVYLFGHDIADAPGRWKGPAKPLLVSSDQGVSFNGPTFSGKWPSSGGGYPLAARVLHNGQVVALYRRQTPGAYVLTQSSDGGGTYRELPAVPKDSLVQRITALSAGFDVDQSRNQYDGRFYLAYPAIRAKRPVVILARSDDGGLSWRNSVAIAISADTTDQAPGYVSIAINARGIIGLSWSEARTQAQYFSYSADGGDTFAKPIRLSGWPPKVLPNSPPTPLHLQSYLQTMGTYEPDVPDSSMGGASAVGKGLSIRLINADLGFVQMSSDPSEAFHPLWVERDGTGQVSLHTRQVRVVSVAQAGPSTPTSTSIDVTKRVLIDVISQEFDAARGEYRIGFTVTNLSDSTFGGPLRLRVRRLTAGQAFQSPHLLGAANGLTGVGAELDLEPQLVGGRLGPGQSTRPYIATFSSQVRESYGQVWHQLRTGETPHPISVEFAVLTSHLVSPR